jgi:aspartyl-tRNA(Asn)/glutamyl-tRNA(Gln) amidotransferase subunit A
MAGPAAAGLQHALEAIRAWNPVVNAMIAVTEPQARERAASLDATAAAGGWAGLLHGMVINLKDCLDLAGTPTTAASVILKDNVPARNAFITDRLLASGAIIVGKSNLHEWVFGPTSQSRHFGPVRNPWNPAHVPGGSSGGSGASVACGMSQASIGSDTAGSIRLPASFTGLAGLRPSVGRISRTGSIAVSAPFDAFGPLARRVEDVARVFAVIAGHDPQDPFSVDLPVPNFLPTLHAPVRGMRIGIMRRWFLDDIHPELKAAIETAVGVFRDLGVDVVEVELGDVERAQEMLAFRVVLADAYALHRERLAARRADYGDDLMVRYTIGERVTGAQYAEALRWMETWRHRLARLFHDGIDAMLSPTTPGPAPAIAGLAYADAIRAIPRFTSVFTSAGVPSLALPCGFTADALPLPLSMELSGPAFGEDRILKLGCAFQAATSHHLRQPVLPDPSVQE